MKKPIIFILGFSTALILGASYKTFFQNEIVILENPFSTKNENSAIEITENIETSNATTSTSTDIQ